MNIEIRLPESGVKCMVILPIMARVKQLQEIIRNEYKIEVNDQLLIAKSGYILQIDDQLDLLQAEKDKTYIADSHNMNALKRAVKALRSQEMSRSPRDEELFEELRNMCRKTASLNPKSEFRHLEESKSKEELGRLQQLNPQILSSINCLLNSDENLLNELNQYEQLKTILEEHIDQVSTQGKSISVLFKSLSKTGDNIIRKKESLVSKIETFKANRDEAVRSVEDLKRQIIPEKLQLETQFKAKSVFDLFLTDPKMKDFITQSRTTLSQCEQKLREFDELLVTYCAPKTGKIGETKTSLYSRFKNRDIDSISTALQKCNNKLSQIKQSRESCYRVIFDSVNRWLRNPDDRQAREYLMSLNGLVEKIVSSNDGRIHEMAKQNECLKNWYASLCKQKIQNEANFKAAYEKYEDIETELMIADKQIARLQNDLYSSSKELSTYWNGNEYRESYEASKTEIEKRLDYCNRLSGLYRQGQKLTEAEEERRRKHISSRKKSKASVYFAQLLEYKASKLILDEEADSKLPRLDVFGASIPLGPNDQILKSLEQLTLTISGYKQSKQNQEPTRIESKLQNLEDILIKTTKICHQVYSNKLREETRKFEETIQNMEELKYQLELALRKTKEENKELKSKEKQEIESQRELKKNKSDLDDYRKKEEHFRSEPAELSKAREDIIKKEELIKSMNSEIRDLQRANKALTQDKAGVLSQLNNERTKHKEESQKQNQKLEESERTLRILRQENNVLEKEMEKLEESVRVLRNQVESHQNETHIHQEEVDQRRVKQLESKIAEIEEDYLQKNNEAEEERMACMQLRIVLQNKEAQIISLEKEIQLLKPDEKSDSDDLGSSDTKVQLNRLRQENCHLQQELESVSYELNLIIRKQTYQVQTQTDKDMVEIEEITPGKVAIFIPYASGVYVPLVMPECSKTEYEFSSTTVSSYKNNYFLNTNNLTLKTKHLVSECSLIVVAKVEYLTEGVAEGDNELGLKEGDGYFLVNVSVPEYVVGFEDDDMALKNYAHL